MNAPLSHDPKCPSCGHAFHHFLGCDWCACQDPPLPGVQP